MSIYEKTNVARALLYWAKNNNGNEAYYLEDRMYAVADNGMVILLTADSYDEAIQKAKARHTQVKKINNLNDFITPKQAFGKIPDVADMPGYDSPITMIVSQMQTKMEADTMSVIQRYGIDVDKDELIKALNYDRGQYEKGYADRGNMIVPVTLEMDQHGTVRQIKGYLDKATQMIYVTLMSVECVEMIGWKIKEGDNE